MCKGMWQFIQAVMYVNMSVQLCMYMPVCIQSVFDPSRARWVLQQ